MLSTLFYLFQIGACWVYPLTQTLFDIESKKNDIQWISFWLTMGVLSYVEQNVLFFIAS